MNITAFPLNRPCSPSTPPRASLLGTMIVVAIVVWAPCADAQAPVDEEVVFEVRFLQADRPARNALARERVAIGKRSAPANFESEHLAVHLLRQDAKASAVLGRRERTSAEWLDVVRLRTRYGLPAVWLEGSRSRVPLIEDPAGVRTDPREVVELASQLYNFGIHIKVTPWKLDSGRLRLKVEPKIVGVDFSRSTMDRGYFRPAVVVDTAPTFVDAAVGQAVLISGFSSDQALGRLLHVDKLSRRGALGRAEQKKNNRPGSELVVLAIPHIISRRAAD